MAWGGKNTNFVVAHYKCRQREDEVNVGLTWRKEHVADICVWAKRRQGNEIDIEDERRCDRECLWEGVEELEILVT